MRKLWTIAFVLTLSTPWVSAALLQVTLNFSSINVTYNGVATNTGNVEVVLTVDTATPDTEPGNANIGFFLTDTAVINAPTLGLANQSITTPVYLNTGFGSLGLSFGGGSFATRTGLWNYQGFASAYTMTDVNDLSTLSVPYTGTDGGSSNVQFLTTFAGGGAVTIATGDFFDANQNSSPGAGNVVIGASIVQVPEPSSSMLLALSGLVVFSRRRRQ